MSNPFDCGDTIGNALFNGKGKPLSELARIIITNSKN